MAPQNTTLQEFEAIWPKLEEVLLAHVKQYGLPEKEFGHYKEVLTNALGGKCNRGISVVDSASILLDRPLTDDERLQASALGWMTELLQAFFLVADDVMDSSMTRRGRPCWYRRPGVGLVAINDSFLLESAIYTLLRHFFRNHPAYADLVDLFHETSLQTELGQLSDLLTAPEDRPNIEAFSLDKFSFIVVFKTAWYSFYLPVALALHLLGLATPANLRQARGILIPLGEYFQAQDDYLDNFADPEHLGKIGTDIRDNKCSWLVCQALARVTPEQRAVLEANYGRKDAEREAVVKRLYDDLRLPDVYREFEESRAAELRAAITEVDESDGLKRGVFDVFLDKIYKRTK